MVSRQAKWAKGKSIIFAVDDDTRKKLENAVKCGYAATEKKKSTKSLVIRSLINQFL
jgi:DNA-binding cell septation regulator SpoVG